MCIRIQPKWRCGCTATLSWNLCKDGTLGEDYKKLPCKNVGPSRKQDFRHYKHCCSTRCCERDIVEKVQRVEDIETEYGIPKGRPWGSRSAITHSGTRVRGSAMQKKQTEFTAAKLRIEAVTKLHILTCLPMHDQVSNCLLSGGATLELFERELPESFPTELHVPDRPEISAETRHHCLQELNRWSNYARTNKDRQLFEQWNQQRLQPGEHATQRDLRRMQNSQIYEQWSEKEVAREQSRLNEVLQQGAEPQSSYRPPEGREPPIPYRRILPVDPAPLGVFPGVPPKRLPSFIPEQIHWRPWDTPKGGQGGGREQSSLLQSSSSPQRPGDDRSEQSGANTGGYPGKSKGRAE